MSEESIRRWAHYTTERLERALREIEEQNGDALPGLIADIRSELARRRLDDDLDP